MKILKKQLVLILIIFVISFVIFKSAVIDLLLFKSEIFNVLFTLIGIFFGIEMSQLMSFDFCDVKDNTKYIELTKSLGMIKNDLFINLIFSSIFFVVKSIFVSSLFCVLFCELYLIYGFIFFIQNYNHLWKIKKTFDQKKRDAN